jgi:hypothetical protein
MVNNATNINKTKASLNSDGQQCHQYQEDWFSLIVRLSLFSGFPLFKIRLLRI